MFGIRAIHDDRRAADRIAISEVQEMMRRQFPGLPADDAEALPQMLADPLKHRFRTLLFVWDDPRGKVQGFAILRHAPDLRFCYLDLISAAPGRRGSGIGSALYQAIRDEAIAMGAVGLFFECLPDDPQLSANAKVRQENADRLAFYERFGALPIANTRYETPVTPGTDNPPYLVLDPLDRPEPMARETARPIVRAILERKYAGVCPPEYVEMVVDSFQDDPVQLRPRRYSKGRGDSVRRTPAPPSDSAPQILLTVNDKQELHHVRERGYVESPVRIPSILDEILPTNLFRIVRTRHFSEAYIEAMHDPALVRFLKRASRLVPDGKSIYPYTFPIRNRAKPPIELPLRAGYYCIDTFTPINRNAFEAARRAVDCVLTLAEEILVGAPLAYALVRPPGHHAERKAFGGFCYFNSAAIAAQQLSRHGGVAMLDLDYHHGNGQQNLFYSRDDVLTISIHGPPRTTYPYFSGFKDERGVGAGRDCNLNLPLPENATIRQYETALKRALHRIRLYQPRYLVICLGLDTAKGDPTGTFAFGASEFERIGEIVGSLALPTLVVQEGGYRTRSLGINARHFFTALHRRRFEKHTPTRTRTAARPRPAGGGAQ